jgi:glycosyltransferase involved in cell wall biosynthesis
LTQSIADYEVIVVDDGSTDGTPGLIAGYGSKHTNLRSFRNGEQQGQPYARNRGIREAKGEIVIFVDSDVIVSHEFVSDHVRLHTRDDFIVQGLVHHIRKPRDAGKFSLLIDGLCLTGLVTQNVSIRREGLLRVGGFDESFARTMGYMDVDIGMRLRTLGLRTRYAFRRCKAWHVTLPPSEEKLRGAFWKAHQRAKNALLLARKHGKSAESRYAKPTKVLLVSRFFQTYKWADEEKSLRFLVSLHDFPMLPLFPIMKEIMKYHYRAKGIVQARAESRESKDNTMCDVKGVTCNAKAKTELQDSALPALPVVGSRREQVQNDSRRVQNDRGKG